MASVLDVIKYCQHAIEKYPNDEQKILKCIDKLFRLDVTVQHLQETGIGRTVNALRKEPGEVGQASRALVYKWKVMVAAEESDQEGDHRNDTSNYNGHVSERDSEDSVPKTKSRNDDYEKSLKASKSLDDKQYKHVNGDISGSKRRYQYSEDHEPEIKKSKHSRSSDDRHKRKQMKKDPSENETQDTDISQTDNSESETSQSSQDNIKQKSKIKEEEKDKHKPSKPKHTSHCNHKAISISEKIQESTGRHSKHKSESRKSEKALSVEKSNESHGQSSSKDRENKSSINDKFECKSKEKEKKSVETSSKHSSRKEQSSNPDKRKNSEKHSNTSEKHKNSKEKTEKETVKSSSAKNTSSDCHKSRESSSSKHSSSIKVKSSDKHVSLKDTDHNPKSDKKQTSSSSSKYRKNDEVVKDKKDGERNSDNKKKHSSSSLKSSKSNSTKKKVDKPKTKLHISNSEDSEDGIDCGSGASFAEALGMISPAKPKKKSINTKDINSPNSFTDLSPASLLAPTAKLAPLPALEISALPEISPNYKPRPPPKLLPHFTDEDAMNHVISSKNQRTKVYSGNKVLGKIPTLYEMCVQILQEHIDALEYTGGVPYEILKPVVDKATPQQLFMLEHYNPYLMDDTDHLWQKFCEKHFRNKQRQEMETWREMYMRCQEEQEHRLKSLTANIKIAQEAKKAPIKQTKMAYVDTVVKPPRNVLRKQALHGTAHASTASPAARVASLAAAPNVLRGGSVRPPPAASVSASTFNKPKKAPLMQKALQFFRGRKR